MAREADWNGIDANEQLVVKSTLGINYPAVSCPQRFKERMQLVSLLRRTGNRRGLDQSEWSKMIRRKPLSSQDASVKQSKITLSPPCSKIKGSFCPKSRAPSVHSCTILDSEFWACQTHDLFEAPHVKSLVEKLFQNPKVGESSVTASRTLEFDRTLGEIFEEAKTLGSVDTMVAANIPGSSQRRLYSNDVWAVRSMDRKTSFKNLSSGRGQ